MMHMRVRWIGNTRAEDRTSAEELTRLVLKNMMKFSLDKRLKWISHIERKEENAWFSKSRTIKVSGGCP